MRRDQLEHAIRTACQIIGYQEVIVVGSPAILGTFREEDLPAAATMSIEVDILPIADSNNETARLVDTIEALAGRWSPFEETHEFSIDGVDLDTSVLPARWRDRFVRVRNANTAAPSGEPQFTGWCVDAVDLCVGALDRGSQRRIGIGLLNVWGADLQSARYSRTSTSRLPSPIRPLRRNASTASMRTRPHLGDRRSN